ncbi:MAG: transporter [Pseudopedobacter saltans]|uniref:Transporter n=1 Tax=Pseudopedobacter saltans TaxID=151895 RepID=A0A2W5H9K3_9SPHI|nr:MAG: transporter [Pseudopedobacter saltans]
MKKITGIIAILLFLQGSRSYGQTLTLPASATDTTLQEADLQTCVDIALKNFPLIKQNQIDQKITDAQIKSKIAEWYPQVNLNGSYQNTFQRLTSISSIGGNLTTIVQGTYNTSAVQLGATQNLFNRDALLASKSAGDVRQNTLNQLITNKIDLVANVTKAYYAILSLMQQVRVLDEDIVRLQRSLKDSYNQYKAGVVDNTGYKQATISLNNSKAQKQGLEATLPSYYALLKLYMNYPAEKEFTVHYDSLQLDQMSALDTNQNVDYQKRIEYKTLTTNKRLLEANLKYEKWSYLPTVSLFANYNLNYFSSRFSDLYKNNYPQSFAGVQVTMPLFQGGKRRENIKVAQFNLDRNAWDFQNLQNSVNQEYQTAISAYKSDLATYNATKENMQLAQEVYNTVDLQYRAGIKTYLDVITAETTLQTSKINFTNALFKLLSDKVDVQKANGSIQPN